MGCIGIVGEYNPFHTGHRYHIEKAKKETNADGVIVVMSGSFVQRGEPAVFDKWTRARFAVMGGADLIIELPAVFALSSAEHFARGAVETLWATGQVKTLSFGSECGDVSLLSRAAARLSEEAPAFREALRESLAAGVPYAAARYRALYKTDQVAASALCAPNNILGVSYIRAIGEKNMAVHTVHRAGADYLDEEPGECFASALALRARLFKGESCEDFLPYPTENLCVRSLKMYEKIILYALYTGNFENVCIPEEIKSRMRGCREGTLAEALKAVKTKDVSMASVKRAFMKMLIGDTQNPDSEPSYIRVLAFNARGAEILHEMKSSAHLPVIDRPAAYKAADPIWETEQRATDIYFLPDGIGAGTDNKTAPVYVQK